jgi:hypothetical protein
MWSMFARFWWMLGGPMVMVLFVFKIVERGDGWFTPADIGFMALIATMIVGRWLEVLGGAPERANGFPAEPGDFKKYVMQLLLFSAVIWIAANVLANVILRR